MTLAFKVLTHKIESQSSKRGVIWIPGKYIYIYILAIYLFFHIEKLPTEVYGTTA